MTNCEIVNLHVKIISDETWKLIFYNVSRELFKGSIPEKIYIISNNWMYIFSKNYKKNYQILL